MSLRIGNKKVCPAIVYKSGTTINNQDKTITSNGTYTADSGYTGLGTVTVNLPFQTRFVSPTTSTQNIVPSSNYRALSRVTIYGVDSGIDSNIVPSNIKSGVTILGVTGTYGGSGGGSVTDYLKKPLISFNCEVITENNPDMGSDTQTLNLSMDDSNDALFNITGKHFNQTYYDASTGTWTSNDGTLTLTVYKDSLNLDSRTIEEEGSTNRYFLFQEVYALYGYFQDSSTGLGNEVLGIYLMNANYDLSNLGTCLCIGVSELYEGGGM